MSDDRTARIRALNDSFRRTGQGGTIVVTAGVRAMGQASLAAAALAVVGFDTFTEDNDPHGEHGFGAFEIDGQRLYWKIDPYDPDLVYGSEDPADTAKTHRVLTILLASEY